MKKLLTILAAMILTLSGLVATANETRNVSEYNLQNGVALKGYDPVSYFPEGDGRPLVGKNQYRFDYMGATYFFANAANLDLFANDVDKYEPTYGGHCAFAMASGRKVDIDPLIYTLNDRRLHFFISNRTKINFDADVTGHEDRADSFWKQISEEKPRK